MTGAGSGGQAPPDGMDAEEAEKCPICLGVLAGGELAMPDSCCHVFCLRCLLTWAELQVAPSCPVDRRPFTNVYRWDGDLSCVQVSVKRQTSEPKSESCCCKKPEQKVCVKKKPARRIKRQKGETMADTKSKGLVRKCNEEESSSLSRKKRRGIECCVWSPSSCVSITASTQDVVWVTEDIPSDTGLKECKAQVQECPWLSLVSPADGILRQHFNPVSWNRSSFSFGHPPSPFSSSTPFAPDHFVFQGVVCAITCPKGGEKRGGRASTSKAPTKEAESLPSRRSGRNSKTQEETPLSDASSPPQSSSSDCDSSTNQSTKTGKASQMPARRKGKQVTNRKASGKRKATTRKKCSPEVVSSSSASEEEGSSDDGVEEETKTAQNPSSCEQEPIDAEDSLNADQNDSADEQGGVDSRNSVAQDSGSDTQEQTNEHAEEDETDHQHHEFSCPAHSAANSPDSWSGGNQSKGGEQEPASPISSRSKDSDERNSPVPSDSHSPLMENLMSPHRNKQTEQDDNMDICTESEEANSEHSSREMKAESFENLALPSSPSPGKLEENVADPDTNSCEGTNVKALGSQESLVGEGMKDDGLSKDDIKVVPMDCSSPMSEHGKSPLLEPPNDSVDAAATGPLPSAQPPAKDESSKPQEEREKSQERKNGRQRRSRFHSPTSTWSPKRESKRDSPRHSKSRSRERDSSPPSSHSSRARSRERGRDRDGDRNHSRRDRSRERRRWRSRSRSRSRSHSRSRSRSRTRSYRRGPSPEPASREHSPHRKERRGSWRSGQGSGFGGEGRRYHGGAGRFENGVPTEKSPDRQGWSDNPDWVTEKTSGEPESRNRESGSSRWEDHRSSGGSRTEPRGRGGRGGFEGGRGAGRGGGIRSFYSQQEETPDSRWQTRNNYSGTSNNSGNDSYSRFNENRAGGRRKESEQGDSMLDRSGWSSASSWAVRRTLPADVQDYYSKRERGGPGGWNRQEEEQQPAGGDPTKSEPQTQAVPGNAPVPVMSVIPPQLNVLPHHYPVQGPRGALPVTLQPAAPYAMPPQVPVHHHPAVPLLQMPAVGAQGLPPPPPPPPPMQQGSQTVAAHSEGHITQMGTNIVGYGKPALLPTLTKAGIAASTQGQPAPSQVLPSSTTQPGHNKAQADSSKKEKKQQIQEKAINEVKTAIKPFYQKKEITKEEYKEIVRKAVEKVCHSKSGEVNSSKVANLVKAYVDKYKHARKK